MFSNKHTSQWAYVTQNHAINKNTHFLCIFDHCTMIIYHRNMIGAKRIQKGHKKGQKKSASASSWIRTTELAKY